MSLTTKSASVPVVWAMRLAIGSPLTPNQTGVRYFCSFADAVVRYNAAAISTCDTTQTPLQ